MFRTPTNDGTRWNPVVHRQGDNQVFIINETLNHRCLPPPSLSVDGSSVLRADVVVVARRHSSHSVFLGPFFGEVIVFGTVTFVDSGNFGYEWIFGVRVRE